MPLPAEAFERAVRKGSVQLMDNRQMLAFGGGHIAGAMNIGPRAELSIWAGWMLDPEKLIFLVLPKDTDLPEVQRQLIRVGYTKFGGYLLGGMEEWANAALPMTDLPQMTVHELKKALPPRDSKKTYRLSRSNAVAHALGGIHRVRQCAADVVEVVEVDVADVLRNASRELTKNEVGAILLRPVDLVCSDGNEFRSLRELERRGVGDGVFVACREIEHLEAPVRRGGNAAPAAPPRPPPARPPRPPRASPGSRSSR